MASKTSSKRPKKTQHTLKELKTLGLQLLTSRTHINNLPILLAYVSPTSPPQYALESLLSLHSFFTPLLPDLPRSSSKCHDDADHIYRTWLRSKFNDFLRSLFDLILSTQATDALRELAMDTIMEFVKLGNRGCFSFAIYHRLLVTLVDSTIPVDFMLDLLASKFFTYMDVRYFTYVSLVKLVASLESRNVSDDKTGGGSTSREDTSKASMELSIRKIHYIISHIPSLEGTRKNTDEELWGGSGFQSEGNEPSELSEPLKIIDNHLKSKNHKDDNVLPVADLTKKIKLKFTKAWISFLRLPLPLDVYKEVLANLHLSVIPYMSNPLILCDFLTRSYDIGGVISVMALSSLFILITQHGLEYPDFYEKLYVLLLPSIFVSKHRGKFFQLLDSCLKSPLLPAYLAAAFTKKLSRLSLVVPPSGALVIIALIHNLLRRHPSINCLVHREYDYDINEGSSEAIANSDVSGTCTDVSAKKPGLDCFDIEESNPAKSHALRSSLWEIDDVRQHYCPPVSRFVLSLEKDLTVRAKTSEVNIEDFSSGSYATIFGEEIRRRVKQVPLAFYKSTPKSLFSETDFTGWTFQHVESKEKLDAEGNEESAAKRHRIG